MYMFDCSTYRNYGADIRTARFGIEFEYLDQGMPLICWCKWSVGCYVIAARRFFVTGSKP